MGHDVCNDAPGAGELGLKPATHSPMHKTVLYQGDLAVVISA